ncbi:Hypothetical protein D9617_9g023480 [Elsinoe fawcettii]|nr:Hypothetical protein D9617_9g023480 [Elsinoe fawcettii]
MASMDPQTPISPGGRRPRTGSRSFSIKSDKSNGPTSPAERAEKERRDSFLRGESKANPNAAVLELQPASRNVMEKVTLDSLRGIQAKDAQGNTITEPDLSNPTRPRWERPLDTIRAFEKAIDGEYSRRSHQRSQSEYDQSHNNNYTSRRSSYMGGYGGPPQNRYNHSGYHNRPDSQYDNYGGAPPLPRQRFGRGMSEGGMGRGPGPNGYNNSQYGHPNSSYETNNSDSTGPWVNSTDPSSQNSSFERLHGLPAGSSKNGQSSTQDYGMHDGYGPQGHSTTIQEETDAYGFPPAPPPKGHGSPLKHAEQSQPPRVPIKLGGGGDGGQIPHQGGQIPRMEKPKQEKRQSWLGRRFSKKN